MYTVNPWTPKSPTTSSDLLRCSVADLLTSTKFPSHQARRLRRRGPGVSAELCLGGPPGARRAMVAGQTDQDSSYAALTRTAQSQGRTGGTTDPSSPPS